MRRLISLLLAVVAGFAFWLAFPDVGWWPCVLVGCGLLWLAFDLVPARCFSVGAADQCAVVETSRPEHAVVESYSAVEPVRRTGLETNPPAPGWCALLGFITGAVFFGPHVWWAEIATALVPWIALVLLQAVFFAALGFLWAFTRRIPLIARSVWWQALVFAVLFTGVEQWRSSIPFGGFPWGRLAWSVAGAPTGRAAWLGASVLVTFILAYAATLIVTAIRYLLARSPIATTNSSQVAVPQRTGAIASAQQILVTEAVWNTDHETTSSRRSTWLPAIAAFVTAAALLFGPLLLPLPHDPRYLTVVPDPPVTTLVETGDRVAWVDAGVRSAENGVLRVGIAQGNVPGRAEAAYNAGPVFQNHLQETYQLAEDAAARAERSSLSNATVDQAAAEGYDVIVWPENAAAWDPVQWPAVASALDQAANTVGAPILIGSMEYPEDGGRYNVMLLWDAQQGVISRYAKQRPAPFGEFIPFRTFARMITDQVDRLPVDMIAATNPPIIGVPISPEPWLDLAPTDPFNDSEPIIGTVVPMGVGICFEVAYDDIFIDAARRGAQVIMVPTNNASFGVTPQSTQQLQMSKMQAITTGKATVQISTVGVSGVFTPDGKLVARTGLFVPDRISALLPLRTSLTPAVVLGMWPARIFQTLALALPILGLFLGRKFTPVSRLANDCGLTESQ